jgi:hypothetical protein
MLGEHLKSPFTGSLMGDAWGVEWADSLFRQLLVRKVSLPDRQEVSLFAIDASGMR